MNEEGEVEIPMDCLKQLGILPGQEVVLKVDRTGLRVFTIKLVP